MNFKQYYQYYLTLHQNKWNRRLHALGQLSTLAFVGFCVTNQYWSILLITPFIVYPFAWSGHFFFEKNKPAAWSNPLWAKACDWIMLKDMLMRKI
jgi:hypothetical protein